MLFIIVFHAECLALIANIFFPGHTSHSKKILENIHTAQTLPTIFIFILYRA